MSEDELPINAVTWEIHDTHPEAVPFLREKLAEVVDPEIGLNAIQLGLVRRVKIENETVFLYVLLTTPFCPYGPAMLEMTRQKAESFFKCPTTIEMGMEMWDFSMMEEGAGADWGIY